MENMFLRTVLRARNFLGNSKTQKKRKKKRKIETEGLGIELELPRESGTWEFNLLLLLIREFFSFARTANCCALDYRQPFHMGITAVKLPIYRAVP